MRWWKALFFFFFFTNASLFALTYDVKFLGLRDLATLKELKNSSDLMRLKKKPPPSINALRYRMENDLPQIIKVLHANGYYDATVTPSLEPLLEGASITLMIEPGQRYTIGSYKIFLSPCAEKKEITSISLKQIGMTLGQSADSRKILQARLALLTRLAEQGYPLAAIENQEVVVDGSEKALHISLCVALGPLCRFGSVGTTGLIDVSPRFIEGKITWKRGDVYSATQIDETQKRILESDLFSSVMVTHADEIGENQELPMKIHLTESKHKSLSLGISYATVDGFGCTFAWYHRNLRHMGEQLSLEGNISQKGHSGIASFRKPDFLRKQQDLIARFEAQREDIFPYLAFTYGANVSIYRKLQKQREVSWGISEEYIDVTHSANDGKFVLLSFPILAKATNNENLLNPISGYTFYYRALPAFNTHEDRSFFFKESLTIETYSPIVKEQRLILALRTELGSIVGPSLFSIPMTKLFLGGSFLNLRGYKYRSVSPRDQDGKPVGGRGAIFVNIEARMRLTSMIGLVPFFDLGCVTRDQYPNPAKKWYKSTGIGLRYFTFFGPLSIDIGFPLNRRAQIDPRYQLYASIGQTF